MSDPLSISASVVGLVAFGLQTADYLYKFYSAYRDRNSELASIADRLLDLVQILQTISDTIQVRKWRSEEKRALQTIERSIARCEDVIDDLQDKVKKLEDQPDGKSKKIIGLSTQGLAYPFRQRTLKKLNEDVNDFRDNLVVALQALQLKDHQNIQNDLDEVKAILNYIQAQQLETSIRDWLNAPDATIDYNAVFAKRHAGTGQWFLQSDSFVDWLERKNSFLWLYGFAGCGKSVLCSTVIQHVFRQVTTTEQNAAAFFFFTFTDKSKQDASALLRTLLLQLSAQVNGLEADLARLKDAYHSSFPPTMILVEYLRQAASRCHNLFIILDALDESPQENSRADVLEVIATIREWDLPSLHFLVTSRDEPDIRDGMSIDKSNAVALQESKVDEDILRYVSFKVENDPRLKRWGPHCETIKKHITERAGGVFRWAECQLQPLRLCPRSKYDLDQCLKQLPKSLDETYERMLLGIDSSCWERAQQMLTFLCLSSRPPTVVEVIDFLAIDLDDGKQYDPDRKMENAGDLLRICPGLITVTAGISEDDNDSGYDSDSGMSNGGTIEATESVRIAHFSVQEYLLSPRIGKGRAAEFAISESAGHARISEACLIYLCNEEFVQELLTPDLIKEYPMAPFAAEFWHYHYPLGCKNLTEAVNSLALKLLTNAPVLERWIRLHNIEGESWMWIDFDESTDEYASPAYYASSLGLNDILTTILESSSANVNAEGGEYGTALQAASVRGYEKTVQILLDAGAEVNTKGGYHATALQAASAGGHEKIGRMLIERGAKVNARGEHDGTALQAASATGNEAIVKGLLDAGAKVNLCGGLYGTALQAASAKGHNKIVHLLLEHKAKINIQEGLYGSALQAAAVRGYEKIVQMLLDNGADVNSVNPQITGFSTPLQAAAAGGNEEIVRGLLDKGAKVNARGGLYGTALQAASARGHKGIVQLLLDKGALVNVYNTRQELYRTALQAASSNGHEQIVDMLINHGAVENPTRERVISRTLYGVRWKKMLILQYPPDGSKNYYRLHRARKVRILPPREIWPSSYWKGVLTSA